jgi:SAM-dependent methyltransferase
MADEGGRVGGDAEFLTRDWDAESARLAARAVQAGEPTAWFETLYAGGRRGEIDMPWDRAKPLPSLCDWLPAKRPGADRSAVVVGCGLGVDAEFVAAHGFRTTAFDISHTAIRTAQERYPDSPVDYRIADMLCLPGEWQRAFDLVVEIINIQALPASLRQHAIAAVANLVTEGGTLLAIENIRQDGDPLPNRPPWPFSRAEIESFAKYGLRTVSIERPGDPARPPRWRAEFIRAVSSAGPMTDRPLVRGSWARR